jgi:uncharacterized spore protein YtfJ
MRPGEECSVVLRQWAAALLPIALLAAGCTAGGGEAAAPAPVPEGAGELAVAGQELYQANAS